MVRPRKRSGTIAWIKVLEDDICTIIEYPTGTSKSTDSKYQREIEKRISDVPNAAHARHTQRPRPRTVSREAIVKAPESAPTPVAPMSTPSVRALPCRICAANTGMSTEYGIATKLTSPSRSKINRMGAVADEAEAFG